MEELINFLSTLSAKDRSGKYYDELLQKNNLTSREVEKKIKKIQDATPRKQPVKHDPGYVQDALWILHTTFYQQSQKYIDDLFRKYDNFTDTYNDLKNNEHPKSGRRKQSDQVFHVPVGELSKELDALGMKYIPTKPMMDARTKEYKEYCKNEDERIAKDNEERAKRFQEEMDRHKREHEELLKRDRDFQEELQKKREQWQRQQDEAQRQQDEAQSQQEEARRQREQSQRESAGQKKEQEPFVRYTPNLSLLPVAKRYFGVTTYTIAELNKLRREKARLLHPDKQNGSSEEFLLMEKYYTLLKWVKENS